ncbi:aminotransferase class I/II-fold pyridoxal phosphate-dependent enzyme [Paenibacillus rhizophilus]|uniref:aminotransferase class I/II-fold pyridoxal phosphate-dependent enzyme n=1 Tax=Paenibacillus rhizophilus TaxID=1850366 RepID=UPI0024828CD5|nr:aminotransferase class I/II-fold pyridoxal phosphate-dependent enzyme [Paenibacillus rhizophilus]
MFFQLTETFSHYIGRITATRNRMTENLRDAGFHVIDSSANFLMMSPPVIRAKMLYEALRERNIFVRFIPKPRIDNYLRVTIGTDEEMDIFYDCFWTS